MSDTIKSRWDWCFSYMRGDDVLTNKAFLRDTYIKYMLMRTQQIFEYDGLPETIPAKDLELILQTSGSAGITEVNNSLYAFAGGLGGELNEYYIPTIFTVSNPYLKFSKNLRIGKDCVVILNDCLYTGLMPLMEKYAALIAECDITLRFGVINARVRKLISADNDSTVQSAKGFIQDIIDGKNIGVIATPTFFEGVKTEDYTASASGDIKDVIELKQYLLSNWWIDLGLNSNFNMKRESLNTEEIGMNDNVLLPFIDEMLERRQDGVEAVNKMYGTNISVKLKSGWQIEREEVEKSLEEETPEESEEEAESAESAPEEAENEAE